MNLPAAWLSELDQAKAQTDHILGLLVAGVRADLADHDPAAAWLSLRNSFAADPHIGPERLASALASAVIRLAQQQPKGDQWTS